MPIIPPLPPFPTIYEVEEYFHDTTANLSNIPHDVAIALRSIYDDLRRFGPPEFPELPELPEVGKLFVVQVPAVVPLPPPPPPKTATERAVDWIKDHKFAVSIAGVAALGAFGYGAYYYKTAHDRLITLRKRAAQKRKAAAAANEPEREIVIILGADSVPYGPSVVRDFQKNGYIVLASVFSGEAADDLERDTEGYVRALVLDAEEPGSIPHFLRSLSSSLSLRFPTTVHGDPYQSMTTSQSTSLARVASVISLLSLGPADFLPFNNFSSPITFSESYTHQFMTRALSPLSILNATLPLFRNRKTVGSPREGSSILRGASMILCVPAAARVGVLGSSSNSMANAAVVQGFHVLKREAALDPMLEDTNLRFITLDVGEFADLKEGKGKKSSAARTPSDVQVLTKTLLSIVDASRRPWSLKWMWTIWGLGSRRSVGAGATTYAIASRLPTAVLDFLLLLPHRLAMLRESLQTARDSPPPTPGPVQSPAESPTVAGPSPTVVNQTPLSESQRTDVANPTPSESEAESSACTTTTSSEADLSNIPTRPNTIADSWVSVQDDE